MDSRLEARRAMQSRLGADGNPLLDLWCLDRDMAQEMEDRYEQQYISAKDGDETSTEDKMKALFAPYVDELNDESYKPTKGDVLAAWEIELREAFPKAYMGAYTREEAVTFLNLMNKKRVDGSISLQLSAGFAYNMFDLMRGWNETHPEEEPISFSGYGDYIP